MEVGLTGLLVVVKKGGRLAVVKRRMDTEGVTGGLDVAVYVTGVVKTGAVGVVRVERVLLGV